jgi:hypothetical protein
MERGIYRAAGKGVQKNVFLNTCQNVWFCIEDCAVSSDDLDANAVRPLTVLGKNVDKVTTSGGD